MVEPVVSPGVPETPTLDENGDELDYVDDVDDLDCMDPGLPEGLNLDDTVHSIHSLPQTPGHWDDIEDFDINTVLEYSHTGTSIGEGVEPLLASTPSHFSSDLVAPIVPSSPASATAPVPEPSQESVSALPKEDILTGPTAESTADEELNLLGAATIGVSPVEALNPGLREAASLVPNLTPEGLNQLQALIDTARRRSRPTPPPGYSLGGAQTPASGTATGDDSVPTGRQGIFVRNLSDLGVDFTGSPALRAPEEGDEE